MPDSVTFTVFKIFLIFFLVLVNGFFVAAEFALVKVRGTKIQALVEKGSRMARMTQHLLDHLDEYLAASQLGITIASILLGWVGENTMSQIVVGPLLGLLNIHNAIATHVISFFLGTGIIVFLHVVIGEQAPKSFAIQRPEGVALAIAYPMKWFYAMMYPFISVLNNSANGFLRLFGISPAAATELAHSEEELRVLFTESQKQGTLSSDKLDLLENIIDFSTLTVRQIMVPRTEVAGFDLRKSLSANLEVAERTAHSRYPLVDGDLDHVVGVIHMKDLFWQLKDMEEPHTAAENAERRNPMIAGGDIALHVPSSGAHFLSAIAREVLFVPESMRIDLLLKEFQQKRIHLAMVVDEYGGTSGMVTFENVIEEIVGEVQDEFDEEAPRIKQINERDYIIEGTTTLNEVNDALKTELKSEDADTIGGFMTSILGRIPKPGDRVEAEGVEMTVREMRRQHIHRLLVKLIPQMGAEEKEAAEAAKKETDKTTMEPGTKE